MIKRGIIQSPSVFVRSLSSSSPFGRPQRKSHSKALSSFLSLSPSPPSFSLRRACVGRGGDISPAQKKRGKLFPRRFCFYANFTRISQSSSPLYCTDYEITF